MVGPYAVLIRHAPEHPERMLVDGPRDCTGALEEFVARALEHSGVELLGRAALSSPIPLRLFETAPGRVRIYQALFADTDFLPGEYEESQRTR
jgi:hypothetical protein